MRLTVKDLGEQRKRISKQIAQDYLSSLPLQVPEPRINITIDFEAIYLAFQDLRYIGELRQRWNEIKKLSSISNLAY